MKQVIQELIDTYPRHYARMIERNIEQLEWVNENSKIDSQNLAAKIYSALHNQNDLCKFGNKLKFAGINQGFKFCGRAGVCECAAQAVSQSVTKSISEFSGEKRECILEKRSQTLMTRYGVSNFGQTETARMNHDKFYQNASNIASTTAKSKFTKLSRYGNESYNNPIKIKQTFKEKSQNGYWNTVYPEKNLDVLNDINQLTTLSEKHTPFEMAELLNVHVQTIYRYLNLHNIRSPYRSSYEQEIEIFLREHGVTNIVCNSRSILPSRKELDIYLPDYNLAIEFNGVYWHHEDIQHITRSYHKNKFDECEKLGIQLITIFSNFWNKKEIVKQGILNKLGLCQQSIYARNTTAKKITSVETKEFLNLYHIQGYTPASICYGLFDNNSKLVATMTFSKSRVAIGKPTSGYELVRYASSNRVVGGASKLLATFKKDYPGYDVFSYSNNEWSNGKLYQSLGFELESDIPVSYWYIHPKKEQLMHRFNYAKQKLVKMGYDVNLTERQITRDMGLLRIWDCGKRKWLLRSPA